MAACLGALRCLASVSRGARAAWRRAGAAALFIVYRAVQAARRWRRTGPTIGLTEQPPRIPEPMIALPVSTPSLRLRHIVIEEAVRMMELNGEPSTRRWLPSHVYADEQEATERMGY